MIGTQRLCKTRILTSGTGSFALVPSASAASVKLADPQSSQAHSLRDHQGSQSAHVLHSGAGVMMAIVMIHRRSECNHEWVLHKHNGRQSSGLAIGTSCATAGHCLAGRRALLASSKVLNWINSTGLDRLIVAALEMSANN